MKIKVIAEGSRRWERLLRRWGISFLLGEELLFDTFGDPGVLLNNFRRFGTDLSRITDIVLSHDHWDHVTGLWWLLAKRKDVTVHFCSGFKQEIKERIASFGVRVVEVRDPGEVKYGIYSTGSLAGEYEGGTIHEQALVVPAGSGATVICGCAHPGVVNIVRHVRERFRCPVSLLVGGFHLSGSDDVGNSRVVKELLDLGVSAIVPMHCTGARARELMRRAFGGGFIRVREGDCIEAGGIPGERSS